MTKQILRVVNAILLLAVIISLGDLIYRWYRFVPRTVYGVFPIECGEALDSDAYYLALICQAVINEKGSLPRDSAEAGRIIADNAARLGFTWPNNFKVNKPGEICTCAGEPFQILVMPDRVAVSSGSLYGYYFAGLKNGSTAEHRQ
jgi:hypothetical protein